MTQKYLRLRRYQTKYFKSNSLQPHKMTMEWYQTGNQWANPQCSWCYRYMQPMDIISFAEGIDGNNYILCDLCLEALKKEGEIEFDFDPYLKDED